MCVGTHHTREVYHVARLTFACGFYDRTEALRTRDVKVKDIELDFIAIDILDLNVSGPKRLEIGRAHV